MLAWAWVAADVGRYRSRVTSGLSGNPIAHWIILLLPVIFFGLFWLTEGRVRLTRCCGSARVSARRSF